MKRLWFGAAALAVLLALGLYLNSVITDLTRSPEQDLDKAAVAALEENWPLASALYLRAENHWDSHRNLTAVLAHHNPIEEIDAGFAALPSYAACEDAVSFCAACSQLAQQLRSLANPHGPHWWNLL